MSGARCITQACCGLGEAPTGFCRRCLLQLPHDVRLSLQRAWRTIDANQYFGGADLLRQSQQRFATLCNAAAAILAPTTVRG
jgi:hypothetical protein